MEAGMLSFSPAFSYFVGQSKESVLFSKSSLSPLTSLYFSKSSLSPLTSLYREMTAFIFSFFLSFFFFCGTRAWIQGLYLEPLHQPFVFCVCVCVFVCVLVIFEIGSCRTICLGWLWTGILLISASWVARIIGVRHWWDARLHLFLSHHHS
jgi:hypothetical protein